MAKRTELWEAMFADRQMLWGAEPSRSAVFAAQWFAEAGAREILIPGVGYGRNALPFLRHGMAVTGIEISATAIELARTQMRLEIAIHHGSVCDMPFDGRAYDGVFSFALLHLLDAAGRAKLLADCHRQLAGGGAMIFTVVSKRAPMFERGTKLGEDWYEVHPGVQMFFYDASSIAREFAAYGALELLEIDEAMSGAGTFPFINIVCKRA